MCPPAITINVDAADDETSSAIRSVSPVFGGAAVFAAIGGALGDVDGDGSDSERYLDFIDFLQAPSRPPVVAGGASVGEGRVSVADGEEEEEKDEDEWGGGDFRVHEEMERAVFRSAPSTADADANAEPTGLEKANLTMETADLDADAAAFVPDDGGRDDGAVSDGVLSDGVLSDGDRNKTSCSGWCMRLASTVLFVLGSALYLSMAVDDFLWARELDRLRSGNAAEVSSRAERPDELRNAALAARAGVAGAGRRRRKTTRMMPRFWGRNRRVAPSASASSSTLAGPPARVLRGANPDELYYDAHWADLPQPIRDAFSALGYDEVMWNGGEWSETGGLAWDEDGTHEDEEVSTSTTQTALGIIVSVPSVRPHSKPIADSAIKLSFEPFSAGPTNGLSANPSSESSTKQPAMKPSTSSSTTRLPSRIQPILTSVEAAPFLSEGEQDFLLWEELTHEIKLDLMILGYNESMWNNGVSSPMDEMSWEELGIGERLAIVSLGYKKGSWDATSPEDRFSMQPAPHASEVSEGDADDSLAFTPSPSSPDPTSVPTPKPIHSSFLANPNAPPQDKPYPGDASDLNAPAPVAPFRLPSTDTGEPDLGDEAQAPHAPVYYYDKYWGDLPREIQDAYAILGHNATTWNEGIRVDVDYLAWTELSTDQHDAALFIGYSEETWSMTTVPSLAPVTAGQSTTAPSSSIVAGASSHELYEDKDWQDLPWDADVENHVNGDDYDTVTTQIDMTSNVTLTSINVGGLDIAERGRSCGPHYKGCDWSELPPHIQKAATALGYGEKLWDMDGPTWSESQTWEELSPQAEKAATLLGYDRYSWGGVDGDDYIFRMGSNDGAWVWVTHYQIIYFFAALSFAMMGVLNLFSDGHVVHILWIFAAAFGVTAAVFIGWDIPVSKILNAMSFHFYLLKAIVDFAQHKQGEIWGEASGWTKRLTLLANFEFAIGASLNVILSYFYLFDLSDHTADWEVSLMTIWIFSMVLWLHCSLTHLGAFFCNTTKQRNELET